MLLQHAKVFCSGAFAQLDVRVEDGRITELAPRLSGPDALDCTGYRLLPGLIDIHTHGCMGEDFSTSQPEGISRMLHYYQQNGITSVCATTMTMPPDGCRAAMRNIREAARSGAGSRILGINMEGPFLNPEKKGAHDPALLTPPDPKLVEELDELSGGMIRLIDLAPELPGGTELLDRFRGKKVLSLAHTACGYEAALEAFDRGADHITHLFNAMNGIHHRDPGIPGALLERDFFAELICDGIHIHPAVIRMVFSLCAEKLVLISDSMSACGLSDGKYKLGGLDVTVRGKKATLDNGSLAGSVTNVFQGMVNAIRFGVPEEAAILSATAIPAASIRCADQAGSIAPGRAADLVLVDDSYQIRQVWQAGTPVLS